MASIDGFIPSLASSRCISIVCIIVLFDLTNKFFFFSFSLQFCQELLVIGGVRKGIRSSCSNASENSKLLWVWPS